jgi:poly(A) polymerase
METGVDDPKRQFAVDVVRRLRRAGFVAYWAGGCVRDRLLGRTAKDYDVATDATPPQIREVFGHRRTIALGAAFGVMTVLGPRSAGQIEVATFRQDADTSDGRRPDHVTFSSPEKDASRRDFTINGLFYDPVEDRVLDFVGGRRDLAARTIRAIGDPRARFREDKLRLIRAVRFAAAFAFDIEPSTFAAIGEMAAEVTVVSAERIAAELQRMLTDRNRARAVRLLAETGLLTAVLPECRPQRPAALSDDERWETTPAVLERLVEPDFPLAMAALLHRHADARTAEAVCRRLRLSNLHIERTAWLAAQLAVVADARAKRWSELQPTLVHPGAGELLALAEARAGLGLGAWDDVRHCRAMLDRPPELVNPPPLLDGNDLIAHGVARGPEFRRLLQSVRDAQLDGAVDTREEALRWIDRIRTQPDP